MAKKKVVKKAPAKAASTSKTAPKKKAAPAKKAPAKKTVAAKSAPKKKSAVKVVAKKSAAAKKPAKKSAPAKTTPAKTTPKQKAKPAVVKDAGRLLAESVIAGMLEKKAINITWLDLRNIENAVCDYFIICEGASNTQVEAIADSVETMVKKQVGQRPMRSEGWENALWILIDYFDVVVHVFEHDTRQFYNLESLWADAEEIPVKQ
jgi:ribosome-associated protein